MSRSGAARVYPQYGLSLLTADSVYGIVIPHHAKDCAAEKARETRHDDPGVGSDCGSSVS